MNAYEWRYLPRGKAKHALRDLTWHAAVCGVSPHWFDPDGWCGTGSQIEYETVEALPECRRCAALVAVRAAQDALQAGKP